VENAGDHGERRDRRQDRGVAAHQVILSAATDIEANALARRSSDPVVRCGLGVDSLWERPACITPSSPR
jgi:hypothetical protein